MRVPLTNWRGVNLGRTRQDAARDSVVFRRMIRLRQTQATLGYPTRQASTSIEGDPANDVDPARLSVLERTQLSHIGPSPVPSGDQVACETFDCRTSADNACMTSCMCTLPIERWLLERCYRSSVRPVLNSRRPLQGCH